jgi:cellulose synthase/poly-beta-1,6-N-acetylglucosamine synthase-like glycosyltransferase
VEYAFTTLINKAVTGWKRPILCSGANLLFHRETFLKIDDFEKHQDQASGDDIYTLRAFRENKLTVQLHESEVLTVVTDVPNTLIEAMHQRIRWAGKSANVADSLSNAIALLSVLMHLGFALLAFVSLLAGAFGLLLTLFGFKLVLDSMLMMSDQKKWNVQTFFNLLFFELAYPFYLVSLLPLLLFLQPEWKGR